MTDSKDYISEVPQSKFGDTLEEQEEQLRSNPLLQSFFASRKKHANDPVRPRYHYCNPEGRLNDPNGLCFWQNRWHMFYQTMPPEDPRPHWGHVVSDDLIHWRDLPHALYPNPEDGCWSGASLVEEDRVLAHYYGHPRGNMTAISRDPLLLNWEKLDEIIPVPEVWAGYRIYDPCIWKKDGFYYSLSGGRLPIGPGGRARPANFLFRSSDLKRWEYLHPFVEDDLFSENGDDGACPYFWPIGNKHMLLFFSHMRGGRYIIGDYDKGRDKLIATDYGRFNFGAALPGGVHAPSAVPDGEGGLIVIFNVNWARPSTGWNDEHRASFFFGCWAGQQIMSLPRRLNLTNENELRITPAGDIESLRGDNVQLVDREIPSNQETILSEIAGSSFELKVEIDTQDSPMVALDVLRAPDKQEYTRIAFYRNRGLKPVLPGMGSSTPADGVGVHSLISIDSSCSSILLEARSRPPETAPVFLEPDEFLKLRVFVDRSIVEVFVNDKQCIAVRVYPGREDSTGVSVLSQGQGSRIISLDAWQMKSIYDRS